MKLFIIAMRDRSADVFGQPQFVPNIGAAIRSFGDEINRQADNNILYSHPDDFDLFVLGTYDDATAEFSTDEAPRQIAVGRDLSSRLKSN